MDFNSLLLGPRCQDLKELLTPLLLINTPMPHAASLVMTIAFAKTSKSLAREFLGTKIPSEMEEAPRYTLSTLLILLTLFNTIYAIRTSLHCLNIDLHAYLYCWGRFERWSGLTRNEQNVGWSGWVDGNPF